MTQSRRRAQRCCPNIQFHLVFFLSTLLAITVLASPPANFDPARLSRRAPTKETASTALTYLQYHSDVDFDHFIFLTDIEDPDSLHLSKDDIALYQQQHPEARSPYDLFDVEYKDRFGLPPYSTATRTFYEAMANGATGIVRVFGGPDPYRDEIWHNVIHPILKYRISRGLVTQIWYMHHAARSSDQTTHREGKGGLIPYVRPPPNNHGKNSQGYTEAADGRWWKDGQYQEQDPKTGKWFAPRDQQEGRLNGLVPELQVEKVNERLGAKVPKAPEAPVVEDGWEVPELPKVRAPKNGAPSAENGKPLRRPGRTSVYRPPLPLAGNRGGE